MATPRHRPRRTPGAPTRRAFLEAAGAAAAALATGCVGRGDGDDEEQDTRTASPDGDSVPDSGDSGDSGGSDSGDSGGSDTAACPPTGEDIEGPFYREGAPDRRNFDLYADDGVLLVLSGRVLDSACAPLSGAVLDLWQSDPAGVYDNDSDEMRYRGRIQVDGEGRYELRTLLPGRYLNGATFRPMHIHCKVWSGELELLTTQIYFAGDPYNETDAWFDPARAVSLVDDGAGGFAAGLDIACPTGA